MIVADDIAKAIGDTLDASDDFTTASPGGFWFDRGPDVPAAYPYTVGKLTADSPRWTSGNGYVQTWRCELSTYTPIGASGSNPLAVETAILGSLTTNTSVNLRGAGERIIYFRPVGQSPRFARDLRQSRDVFICGLTIEAVCQGNRGVA